MRDWKKPSDEHIVYEALSSIADKRIETSGTEAKCYSTSRNKFYTIKFNLDKMLFMSNDNMAYYKSEVSYPMLAVLLLKQAVLFNSEILPYFKNIPWKDINQKNNNNYMKSVAEFLEKHDPATKLKIQNEIIKIYSNLPTIHIWGQKTIPPKEY